MITVGSLFAGIGGLDLGLERAGMTVKWQVELDDYATQVLEKHWPNVTRFRGVRECGAHNLEAVDLICGGPPCQPVSYAGHGRGENDERWLWPEFCRIVRELQPQYALVENVPALVSRGLGTILRDLAASGYDAEWQVLSARALGAPHLRRRVFILAYPMREHGDTRMAILQPDAGSLLREADRNRAELWAKANAPDFRVADGPARKLDAHRMRCLGNSVVPQVAEWVGRRIVEAHNA